MDNFKYIFTDTIYLNSIKVTMVFSFSVAAIEDGLEELAALEHLRIEGLMAIPPPAADPEGSRPWFRRLKSLRDELFARPVWSGRRGLLSMGMSGDFEVAIEEGATHVRIGSALFGAREG